MKKDDLVYVGEMLDIATQVVDKVHGITHEDYDQDENLRLALVHLIQTIGEAARRVSHAFQEDHPEIPWSAIIGMRHKIVHDYVWVDYGLVWDVVTVELPALVKTLRHIVPPEEK